MALKLAYWGDVARAGAIMASFQIAKVPYDLESIARTDFPAIKGDETRFPLGQIPVLTFPDGRKVTQSLAIAKYAGCEFDPHEDAYNVVDVFVILALAGLVPQDPLEVLLVDEIIISADEVLTTRPKNPDAAVNKPLTEEWVAGKLQKYLRLFNRAAESGSYLVGGKLSLADIFVHQLLKRIRSGGFDFVPVDVDASYPALGVFFDLIKADPVFGPYA